MIQLSPQNHSGNLSALRNSWGLASQHNWDYIEKIPSAFKSKKKRLNFWRGKPLNRELVLHLQILFFLISLCSECSRIVIDRQCLLETLELCQLSWLKLSLFAIDRAHRHEAFTSLSFWANIWYLFKWRKLTCRNNLVHFVLLIDWKKKITAMAKDK